MSEIVEGQVLWQTRRIAGSLEAAPSEVPTLQRPAGHRSEDRRLVTREPRPQPESDQLVAEIRRQRDRSQPRLRLRRPVLAAAEALPLNPEHARVPVEVLPAQPETLPEAQPERDRDTQDRRVVERPRLWCARRLASRPDAASRGPISSLVHSWIVRASPQVGMSSLVSSDHGLTGIRPRRAAKASVPARGLV